MMTLQLIPRNHINNRCDNYALLKVDELIITTHDGEFLLSINKQYYQLQSSDIIHCQNINYEVLLTYQCPDSAKNIHALSAENKPEKNRKHDPLFFLYQENRC